MTPETQNTDLQPKKSAVSLSPLVSDNLPRNRFSQGHKCPIFS